MIYNDGFVDKQVSAELPIFMRNMPPQVSITEIKKELPLLGLKANIVNRDDDIESIKWVISKLLIDKSSNASTKVRLDVIQDKDFSYNLLFNFLSEG